MDDHLSAEAPPEVGAEEEADLARRQPLMESRGDDDRQPLHAESRELGNDRGDRFLARVGRGRWNGQMRWLDHQRRGAAARHEPLERRACEREAESFAHRRPDIDDRGARGGGPQDDTVARYVDDRDPRARKKRDPLHYVRRAAAAVAPSATKMPPVT